MNGFGDVGRWKHGRRGLADIGGRCGGLYDEARANAEANLKAMFAAALGDQTELTVVFREA